MLQNKILKTFLHPSVTESDKVSVRISWSSPISTYETAVIKLQNKKRVLPLSFLTPHIDWFTILEQFHCLCKCLHKQSLKFEFSYSYRVLFLHWLLLIFKEVFYFNSFLQDFGEYQESYYSVQTTEGEQISQLIAGYIDIILKKV